MELTDAALSKAIERTAGSSSSDIRIGIIPSGCAGWEYVIDYANEINSDDTVTDYGKFKIVIDEKSLPFLNGSILDWAKIGLNESFKIINTQEESSCGCGVSVQFKT